MHKVFLNGSFVDADKASISPMDRGFLFGDGIYEVIPTYSGKPVGLNLHLARMNEGLRAISLDYQADEVQWRETLSALVQQSDAEAQAVYIHVSRGADNKRFHAYPKGIQPTIFAYAFDIAPSQDLHAEKIKAYHVTLAEDLRWQRCHIKSTSLLGNVMHFQQGQDAGKDEVILYNQQHEVTEASACNVFIVKDGRIATPQLDNHLLPGITRRIAIEAISKYTSFPVDERVISLAELKNADEVWISSSSKELGPVLSIDDIPVGEGKPGNIWREAQQAYNRHKFDC